MPTATLTFNLPEERSEWLDAIRGADYACKLHEIENVLRRYRKYEEMGKKELELFTKIDDEIRLILNDSYE